MTAVLRIFLIAFAFILLFVTTMVLKKGRIPIKYSLLWYLSGVIILAVAIFPFSIECITTLIGFKTTSNFVIGIIISLLLFLTMSLTIITSGQKKKITLLIQEVSILKSIIDKIIIYKDYIEIKLKNF